MKNLNFKAVLPVVTGIVIFIVLTFGYFSPLLHNKVITQSDMVQHAGMAKEISDFRAQYHSEPLWTNSMFGGMPAYQISAWYPANLVQHIREIWTLWFPTPANMVFSYMLGFFILLLVLKVDKWLSIVGAVAFGFSAFFFLIITAGHNTQALAIGYMAPVFAGVILVCRGRYLLGGALTALFMALELLCNHVQITYYLVLFLAVYVIFEWVAFARQKKYADIGKSLLIFVVAATLAIGCNITSLWNSYDYAKYTIRGPSELSADKGNKTSGLDKDYATQWSLGKSETLTLMIPGFKGRSSSISMAESKAAMKAVEPEMRESIGGIPQYWGDQPFTDAPYSGAIVVFLFVLGLFIVPGRFKWSLLTASLLGIFLAWGHNMMWLTDLFLDHFPGYNKFRAVSMILVLAEFAIPVLAVLAVDKLIRQPEFFKQKIMIAFTKTEITVEKAFYISFALTGVLCLLFYLFPDLNGFSSVSDSRIYDSVAKSNGAEIAQRFMDNVETARKALFRTEALRSFFLITGAAAAIWLFVKGRLGKPLLIAVLGILILADLATVDRSYLNDKNFTTKKEATEPFKMTTADKAILEDKDPDYRVLNVATNTFNETSTSYFHKSIGGYHAAKLRRYQDLIDHHIQNNIQDIISTLRANPTDSSLRATFARLGVLNMLNTRYIIYNPEAPPLQNRYALGNAWFVTNIKMVKNADEEIAAIGQINPASTVTVDERYKSELEGFTPKADSKAGIRLTSYKANDLSYESNSESEQLAVFSEIYYPAGWNAYVDGELKPHFQADYVLRAMRIPAGKHTIEFKFEPKKYYTGEKIALTSCILLFLSLILAIWLQYRKNQRKQNS